MQISFEMVRTSLKGCLLSVLKGMVRGGGGYIGVGDKEEEYPVGLLH